MLRFLKKIGGLFELLRRQHPLQHCPRARHRHCQHLLSCLCRHGCHLRCSGHASHRGEGCQPRTLPWMRCCRAQTYSAPPVSLTPHRHRHLQCARWRELPCMCHAPFAPQTAQDNLLAASMLPAPLLRQKDQPGLPKPQQPGRLSRNLHFSCRTPSQTNRRRT